MRLFFVFLFLFVTPVMAQDLFLEDLLREMESELIGEKKPEAAVKKPDMANELEKDIAVIRGLDKITARIQDFHVPVGDMITFNGLEVHVKSCQKKPPEDMPESAVFLEIYDTKKDHKKLFKGWMFSSSPALSALQHPTLDIWLRDCLEVEIKEELPAENMLKAE